MTRRQVLARWTWPLVVLLILACCAAYETWPVLSGGGDVLYSVRGDDWKNIYTFVYHVLHDPSPMQTVALHWPWGDHVAMSDAQPLISNALRPVARSGWVDERQLTYLVLVLPILSLALCGLVMYSVFRELGLPPFWAAAWAVSTALLQPQLWRYSGHYALAYAWVLPLLLKLWLRARRLDYAASASLWVGVTLLLCGLVHLYYLGLGGAMLIALLGFDWLTDRRGRLKLVSVALALQVILPVFLGTCFTKIGEDHPDRIAEPYGLIEYKGKPIAAVADTRMPYWRWFNDHVVDLRMPTTDGYVYLGLGTVAALSLGVWLHLRRRDEWEALRRRDGHVAQGRLLVIMSLASFAMLVFSWGVPLGLSGAVFDDVRSLSGPLRQLRALGRFGWGAFYMLSAVGATLATTYLLHRDLRWVLAALVLVNAVEGSLIWRWFTPGHREHVLAQRGEQMRAAVAPYDVEAVVPLPFYSVGSEDFSVPELGTGLYTGSYPSLALGVPNAGLYMSRTSFGEAVQMVGLTKSWWNVNPVLRDSVPRGRRLLVSLDLAAYGQDWVKEMLAPVVEGTRELYRDDMLSLRLLDPEDLAGIARARRRRYLADYLPGLGLDTLDRVVTYGGDRTSFVRAELDDRTPGIGIRGSGGVALTRYDTAELYDGPLPAGSEGTTLAFGLHAQLNDEGQIFSFVSGEFLDERGRLLHRAATHMHLSWVTVHDKWLYAEWYGEVPDGARRLRIRAAGSEKALSDGLVVDEVTVRVAGMHYAYPLGTLRVVNGRLLEPLSDPERGPGDLYQ